MSLLATEKVPQPYAIDAVVVTDVLARTLGVQVVGDCVVGISDGGGVRRMRR